MYSTFSPFPWVCSGGISGHHQPPHHGSEKISHGQVWAIIVFLMSYSGSGILWDAESLGPEMARKEQTYKKVLMTEAVLSCAYNK